MLLSYIVCALNHVDKNTVRWFSNVIRLQVGLLRLGRVLFSDLVPSFLPLLHSSSPPDHAFTDFHASDKTCLRETGSAGKLFFRVIWRSCQRTVDGDERATPKTLSKDRTWTTNGAPFISADNQLKLSLDVPYFCVSLRQPERFRIPRISIGLEAHSVCLGSLVRFAKNDSSDECNN